MSLFLTNAVVTTQTVNVSIPSQVLMPWKIGKRYDYPASHGGGLTTGAVTANTMYAFRLIPVSDVAGGQMVLSAIDFRVNAVAAGKKARMALYAVGADYYPGTLIAQSVEKPLDTGANATENDTTFAATLTDQVPVYAVFWGDGAATMIVSSNGGNEFGITTTSQGGQIFPGLSVAQTYTAGSSSFPGTAPSGWAPSLLAVNISVKRGS